MYDLVLDYSSGSTNGFHSSASKVDCAIWHLVVKWNKRLVSRTSACLLEFNIYMFPTIEFKLSMLSIVHT